MTWHIKNKVEGNGGGGGGTDDYNALSSKPSINNVILSGDKSTADLGITEVTVIDGFTSTSPTFASSVKNTTELKGLVDALSGAIVIQGNWNANTNTPDITTATTTGFAWIVSVDGNTDLGGITDWSVNDLAVKTDTGWAKIDNTSLQTAELTSYDNTKITVANYNADNVQAAIDALKEHGVYARSRSVDSAELESLDYNEDVSIYDNTGYLPADIVAATVSHRVYHVENFRTQLLQRVDPQPTEGSIDVWSRSARSFTNWTDWKPGSITTTEYAIWDTAFGGFIIPSDTFDGTIEEYNLLVKDNGTFTNKGVNLNPDNYKDGARVIVTNMNTDQVTVTINGVAGLASYGRGNNIQLKEGETGTITLQMIDGDKALTSVITGAESDASIADYSDTKIYGSRDSVFSAGIIYTSRQANNVGHDIDNEDWWIATSAYGQPLIVWNDFSGFAVGRIVSHNGLIWKALQANSGNEPVVGSIVWENITYKSTYHLWDDDNAAFFVDADIFDDGAKFYDLYVKGDAVNDDKFIQFNPTLRLEGLRCRITNMNADQVTVFFAGAPIAYGKGNNVILNLGEVCDVVIQNIDGDYCITTTVVNSGITKFTDNINGVSGNDQYWTNDSDSLPSDWTNAIITSIGYSTEANGYQFGVRVLPRSSEGSANVFYRIKANNVWEEWIQLDNKEPVLTEYSENVTYNRFDVVSQNGLFYSSKQASNTGNGLGTDNDWWLGINAYGRPVIQWNEAGTFFADDIVGHNGKFWRATAQNTNITPTEGIFTWLEITPFQTTIDTTGTSTYTTSTDVFDNGCHVRTISVPSTTATQKSMIINDVDTFNVGDKFRFTSVDTTLAFAFSAAWTNTVGIDSGLRLGVGEVLEVTISGVKGSADQRLTGVILGAETVDENAIHKTTSAEIVGVSTLNELKDPDVLLSEDSTNGNWNKRRVTAEQIKNFVKAVVMNLVDDDNTYADIAGMVSDQSNQVKGQILLVDDENKYFYRFDGTLNVTITDYTRIGIKNSDDIEFNDTAFTTATYGDTVYDALNILKQVGVAGRARPSSDIGALTRNEIRTCSVVNDMPDDFTQGTVVQIQGSTVGYADQWIYRVTPVATAGSINLYKRTQSNGLWDDWKNPNATKREKAYGGDQQINQSIALVAPTQGTPIYALVEFASGVSESSNIVKMSATGLSSSAINNNDMSVSELGKISMSIAVDQLSISCNSMQTYDASTDQTTDIKTFSSSKLKSVYWVYE